MANQNDELINVKKLIIARRLEEALSDLRNQVRDKIAFAGQADPKTPTLDICSTSADSLEELFALCAWESQPGTGSNNKNSEWESRIANDALLLDQCVTKAWSTGKVPYAIGAAWLTLKCRPKASRDELNDAQQLLDRYLRQFAREVDEKTIEVTELVQSRYAFLVELLTCRVLPALGLMESALSFIAKENTRKDLLTEEHRLAIESMVRTFIPSPQPNPRATAAAPKPVSEANENPSASRSAATPPQVPTTTITSGTQQTRDSGSPAPATTTTTQPSAQQMVEEFERRKRQDQEEQMKTAMTIAASVSAAVLVGYLISERKRVANAFTALGDLLFGE